MEILFLEPFYAGSHKAVADGFATHSSHRVHILTLPARFWKWRMRGASLFFIRQVKHLSDYDLVLATDMVDITDFKALAGKDCPPIALYFHENQLSYPLSPGERRDFHLGFTNIISALAADRVFFNSHFHRDDFLNAAHSLIQRMPDCRPGWMLDKIKKKSFVLYPGIGIKPGPTPFPAEHEKALRFPLVVWNHRWEHDKNPKMFFNVLEKIKKKGIGFYLAIMGEKYDAVPSEFDTAPERFRDELVVFGYQENSDDYLTWLHKGTVLVSTAVQENFGISVMEAVACGCFPLLPDRLSYPELFPPPYRPDVIFKNETDLQARLEQVLTRPEAFYERRLALTRYAEKFSWDIVAGQWDRMLTQLPTTA